MKFICISDTHGLHRSMAHTLPEADGIIHAGDFCNRGSMKECMMALGWFNALPYKHRIIIAGNHDLFMDPDHLDQPSSESAIKAILPISDGFHYLWNSGCEIEGIKFWGSPQQPEFFNWAFNLPRGTPLREHWELIPEGTDVLITHGPAYGLVDKCPNFADPNGPWVSVGDNDLAKKIRRIEPKVHVCGHVHSSYGHAILGMTTYINASTCNEGYFAINKPIAFNIDTETKNTTLIHYV